MNLKYVYFGLLQIATCTYNNISTIKFFYWIFHWAENWIYMENKLNIVYIIN